MFIAVSLYYIDRKGEKELRGGDPSCEPVDPATTTLPTQHIEIVVWGIGEW